MSATNKEFRIGRINQDRLWAEKKTSAKNAILRNNNNLANTANLDTPTARAIFSDTNINNLVIDSSMNYVGNYPFFLTTDLKNNLNIIPTPDDGEFILFDKDYFRTKYLTEGSLKLKLATVGTNGIVGFKIAKEGYYNINSIFEIEASYMSEVVDWADKCNTSEVCYNTAPDFCCEVGPTLCFRYKCTDNITLLKHWEGDVYFCNTLYWVALNGDILEANNYTVTLPESLAGYIESKQNILITPPPIRDGEGVPDSLIIGGGRLSKSGTGGSRHRDDLYSYYCNSAYCSECCCYPNPCGLWFGSGFGGVTSGAAIQNDSCCTKYLRAYFNEILNVNNCYSNNGSDICTSFYKEKKQDKPSLALKKNDVILVFADINYETGSGLKFTTLGVPTPINVETNQTYIGGSFSIHKTKTTY